MDSELAKAVARRAWARARGARGYNGHRPWPEGERAPDEGAGIVELRDVCPPWSYASPIPPPPPERKGDPCPDVSAREEAFICAMAREMGKEVANYAWNPYVFPTPFSQDFIEPGENTIAAAPAVGTRFRLARFKVPPGYVGVLTAIATEIPPALQTFVLVRPTLNDAAMKTVRTSIFAGSGDVAPSPVQAGVHYQLANLTDPLRVFHPLQEEMVVGIEVVFSSAPPAAAFPATLRGLVIGRYWVPNIATRYWTFNKSD